VPTRCPSVPAPTPGENVSHAWETLPRKVLYLLAAPSTPDEVRTEVIERTEAGEHLTHAQVKPRA
jgi:hypothetical protein